MRYLTVLAAIVVFASGWGLIRGCGSSTEDQATSKAATAQRRANDEKDSFFYMSQHFVEKRLKSPGSAKFPPPSGATVTKLGDNKYRVSAYFDSRNNSGALLRSNYVCELTKISSAKWHCDDMKISN